jgi:hypothetical protein
MLGTELPVSMYTTKTPIDKCRFNVTQLNYFFPFSVKDRYQLNYFYQSLQCTDNYFFNRDHQDLQSVGMPLVDGPGH